MISVYQECPACLGCGYVFPPPAGVCWLRCAPCAGLGRVWVTGAPAFGCATTLADRDPGEIVTLGNGDCGKILWHMPRKTKKVLPETTFLGLIEPFTGEEDHRPIAYPSCVGVLRVDFKRSVVDRDSHDRERCEDLNDPMQRTVAGKLIF